MNGSKKCLKQTDMDVRLGKCIALYMAFLHEIQEAGFPAQMAPLVDNPRVRGLQRRGPAQAGASRENFFHLMLFATRRRREPSRPAASVPLHTARHAVCSGTLAVSRRCRVRHWQRNNLPGLCSADGGVEQMKKILSE